MGLVEDEVVEVRKLCPNRIGGSRIITCTLGLLRVEISKSSMKTVAVSLQFPSDYPKVPVLIELQSKHLGDKFLNGLTLLCEEHARKFLGKPQVMKVLEFVEKFIDDHPLCACADEIATIRNDVLSNWPHDELKLKHKASSISLTMREASYVHKAHIFIPTDYPSAQVTFETKHSHLSDLLQRFLQGQGTEIARRCVEPPLSKKQFSASKSFTQKPSLLPLVSFLCDQFHKFVNEKCSRCEQACLPKDPEDVINNENDDAHVERVYCGHLYHLHCLLDYMKTPPFEGGKKCLACGKTVYHEKYKVSQELSESRWAHKQARDRELEEIAEFLS